MRSWRHRQSEDVTEDVMEAIQTVLDEEAKKRSIDRPDLKTARPTTLSPEKQQEMVAMVRRILGGS